VLKPMEHATNTSLVSWPRTWSYLSPVLSISTFDHVKTIHRRKAAARKNVAGASDKSGTEVAEAAA